MKTDSNAKSQGGEIAPFFVLQAPAPFGCVAHGK
jgi:hypothetical protein